MFDRDLRLRREVLWMFRMKARGSRANRDDAKLDQMPHGGGQNARLADQNPGFSIHRMYSNANAPGQYQPHALFGGRINARFDKAELMAIAIGAGKSNRDISREQGVSAVTVTKLRRILVNEYGVKPLPCACGMEASHWGRCSQGRGRERLDAKKRQAERQERAREWMRSL